MSGHAEIGYAQLKQKAHDLFEEAGFLTHMQNNKEYEAAPSLMDDLIEDYDYNRGLIERRVLVFGICIEVASCLSG